MIYTVEAGEKINLKAKGIERILQNCCNILSVYTGEVVLGRGIGIHGDVVDSPLNKARKTLDIKKQLETYESRVRVEKTEYKTDHLNGVLRPIVEVRIVE